jgi:alkylation response protein AidB-like acyl-CoA dehydrogenase
MQARAAAFAREQVIPAVDGWEREGRYPRAVVAASGLTGLFCPSAVGGAALTYPEGMVVFEELGRGDAALAFSLSMHNAVAAAVSGHPELAARWAGPLASGEVLGGFSLTEPQAGSDATAITTRAEPYGDGWRVTGRKAWVSLAGEADLFLVVCKTSDDPGHRDVAIVAVERASPGVSFPALYRKACADFLPIGEMELAGAPATRLAPPGQGMRAALGAIDVARCDIAAIAAGLHAEALDVAVAYAEQRTAFGRPILDLQAIQFALADVATELEASRLLYRQAAERLGTPDGSVAVAHAKRFCPDAALRAAIACSETLGAYGWLLDHPLARMIALAKMLQVVDGTAEIQRLVIGRSLASSRSPQGSRSRGTS